jgi:bacillithiol biosynthesis deacetylase BshB1
MEKLDLLVIAAHPDDAELGCGGTIARLVQEGRKVGIVDLTQGELGTRGTPELRIQEATEAGNILGIHARENLGLRDGRFENSEQDQIAVIRSIRKYRPDIVITNAPEDRHPDHGRAARLVADSCFYSGLRKILTDYNGLDQEAWKPKALFHFVQSQTLPIDFVIDISAQWQVKIKSIKAYKSQFFDPQSKEPETYISSPDFLRMVEARAIEHGHAVGKSYGEGFIRSRVMGINSLFDLY